MSLLVNVMAPFEMNIWRRFKQEIHEQSIVSVTDVKQQSFGEQGLRRCVESKVSVESKKPKLFEHLKKQHFSMINEDAGFEAMYNYSGNQKQDIT
ncbi:hypothetical protein FRX31_010510 [Thalictrum thalictroides]|uniref:Uncharacterized protein n=1 Tax=Thalictrum thalictroides TaxID=46969 RepID=A0A7J6WV09_THATH|nr:hypothetical protein FRX31_010510 [Thalictrum thalictroides]